MLIRKLPAGGWHQVVCLSHITSLGSALKRGRFFTHQSSLREDAVAYTIIIHYFLGYGKAFFSNCLLRYSAYYAIMKKTERRSA